MLHTHFARLWDDDDDFAGETIERKRNKNRLKIQFHIVMLAYIKELEWERFVSYNSFFAVILSITHCLYLVIIHKVITF